MNILSNSLMRNYFMQLILAVPASYRCAWCALVIHYTVDRYIASQMMLLSIAQYHASIINVLHYHQCKCSGSKKPPSVSENQIHIKIPLILPHTH